MNDIYEGGFSLDELLKEAKSYTPDDDINKPSDDYNIDALIEEIKNDDAAEILPEPESDFSEEEPEADEAEYEFPEEEPEADEAEYEFPEEEPETDEAEYEFSEEEPETDEAAYEIPEKEPEADEAEYEFSEEEPEADEAEYEFSEEEPEADEAAYELPEEEPKEEIFFKEDFFKIRKENTSPEKDVIQPVVEENTVEDPTDFERKIENKIEGFLRHISEEHTEDEPDNDYSTAIENEQRQFHNDSEDVESDEPSVGRTKRLFSKFSFKPKEIIVSSMDGCTAANDEMSADEADDRLSRDVEFLRICTGMVGAATIISVLLSVVPQFLASFFSIESALAVFGGSAKFYLVSNLVLLTVGCVFGFSVIKNGVKALFKGCCCADTGVTLALALCFIQNILFMVSESPINENIRLLGGVGLFSLLLLTVSKLLHLQQLHNHFEFCNDKEKPLYGAVHILSSRDSAAIGKGVVSGEPELRYSAGINSPSLFFETAAKPLPSDRTMRKMLPSALIAGIAVGVIAWVISKDFLTGFTALTAMACISVPAAVTLGDILPFVSINNSLSKLSAGIHSCAAAEECAQTDGIIFDANEIFKNGGTVSPNFKPFTNSRIDEALLSAAALTESVDGPLKDSFKSMIISDHNILPIVKGAHYDEAYGIEGRVNGRTTLLGNRELMEKHGVPMPSLKEERPYRRDGSKLLYLAESGSLAAMFVVTYQANRTAGGCMRRLVRDGVMIYVRSDDPGITEGFVEEIFRLPQNSVKILRREEGALFKNKYENVRHETAEITVAHRGRLSSFLTGIDACFRLKETFKLSQKLAQLALGFGFALFAILSFAAPQFAGASQIFVFQLLAAAIGIIVPLRIKRKK